MTENRRSKRAIRSHMAQTGQKYTEARRDLLGPGGGGEGPGAAVTWPEDPLGWFTDQAYNAILLAADEARMLSHPRVDPEHLLLAAARNGNVERLLADKGIGASAIHDAIVAVRGHGDRLELRPRRSPASEQVLRRAVTVAAALGTLGPSTEQLLVALGEQEFPARILAGLGAGSAQALAEPKLATYLPRPPIDQAHFQRRAAQLAARGSSTPPNPGPMPPVFERFTAQARDAINAGIQYAHDVDDAYVEPAHLLHGVLTSKGSVVATVRARQGWDIPPGQFAQPPAIQPPYSLATGIFSPQARRIVAEGTLIVAERLGHRALTTGHVLIAILERPDEHTGEIISSIPGLREVTAIIDALPGREDI